MKEKRNRKYIELLGVALSDDLALIAKLVEEQKPPETVLADEMREADEGDGGDAAEGELRHSVVRPAVAGIAVGAGEDEVREGGDENGHGDEDEPREAGGPRIRLIHAQPFQPPAERLQLVVSVRRHPHQRPPLLGRAHQRRFPSRFRHRNRPIFFFCLSWCQNSNLDLSCTFANEIADLIGDDGVYAYEIKPEEKEMIFWILLISFIDDLWKIRVLFGGKYQ